MNRDNTVNAIYNDICSSMCYELNIPLYITGDEFVNAMLSIFGGDDSDYCVISDSPVMVICGNRNRKSFGLREGSMVSLKKDIRAENKGNRVTKWGI
jgi:hypothetical protein